jgi:hypothetical protein
VQQSCCSAKGKASHNSTWQNSNQISRSKSMTSTRAKAGNRSICNMPKAKAAAQSTMTQSMQQYTITQFWEITVVQDGSGECNYTCSTPAAWSAAAAAPSDIDQLISEQLNILT